jgi:hypothetical protein
MKRKSTKNRIHDAERRLCIEVKECLATWKASNENWKEGTREVLALWITHLLSLHVQLDYSWPRDRWLDGIDIAQSVVSDEGEVVYTEGVLWWGLLSDVGGKQISEPFSGTFRLTNSPRRPIQYELRFGTGAKSRSFIHRDARSNNGLQRTRR